MQYLVQVYLPSCMFVVVSWVSFLIKPEVVPGRMALLVTLFLVLINIFNSVRYVPTCAFWNFQCNPYSQYGCEKSNKSLEDGDKTFAGLKSTLQRFRIYFF